MAYRELGFYPGQALVSSVLLALLPQLRATPSSTLKTVLQALADFSHHPGDQAMRSLVSELHSRWSQGQQCSCRHMGAALYACACLGFHPGERFVGNASDAVLVGQHCEDEDEDENENENEGMDGQLANQEHGAPDNRGREEQSKRAGRAGVDRSSRSTRFGAPPSSTTTSVSSSSSSGSSSHQQELFEPEEIAQVLWSLVVLRAVTAQRLGLGCVGLRHGGYMRRLSDMQLCAVAAASLAVGQEGPEMVEEVSASINSWNGASGCVLCGCIKITVTVCSTTTNRMCPECDIRLTSTVLSTGTVTPHVVFYADS